MEGDRPFPQDILDMVMEAFALMYPPFPGCFPIASRRSWR